MKICIVVDDNAGYTKKETENTNIFVVKMPILINNEIFYERENITYEEFFSKLADDKNNVKTSQPSPGEIISLWSNLLEEYEQVIHIPMSSGLSESCNTAKGLAQDPEFANRVFVVDNHRISVTIKDSVRDAQKLINEGKTGAEIKQILEQNAFNSTIYIMVDTLKYLKRGGRITPATAALGTLFRVKPVLSIFGEKLDSYSNKAMGLKKAKQIMINAVENDIKTKFKDVAKDKLAFGIAYTYDEEAANLWKKEIEEHFNVKDIEMNPLSLSVATHIGPGALAVTLTEVL